MSIAVIGGLITSTVLSLLVVPAVFTYIDDIGDWSRRMANKLRRRDKPPSASKATLEPASSAPPANA